MTNFKIKKEKMDEWEKCVVSNSTDSYSFGVLIAVCASFDVLDAGGTPEEARQVWTDRKLDLSGFMAGCAAHIVSAFHERGDEFRIAWNKRYGVDETKAQGGTVNPAIVTVGV